MDTNYFVCTLGQAAKMNNNKRRFNNINHFIDHQAEAVGDSHAVGFFEPSEDRKLPWNHQVLSFASVRKGSIIVANLLSRKFQDQLKPNQTVALMCPSSPTFLFMWLGLIRLGHPVLLIAPQCQPAAVAHLCKECNASILFTSYPDRSPLRTSAPTHPLSTIHLPTFFPPDILATIASSPEPQPPSAAREPSETDTAYLHHTSGTSTGLPKPIPQPHRAAVAALPHLPTSPAKATFTTTPLYHGGVADLFRAWTSDAPCHLFPAQHAPITAATVNACLAAAAAAASSSSSSTAPPSGGGIAYFASVPYVLQMLAADDDAAGLRNLRAMELVGVGGAAMAGDVGDALAAAGVRLVSRYGSAECGFLMSSHREYASDAEWQYLRCGREEGAGWLAFEEVGGDPAGLAEVVVRKGWPHMAKTNRGDGSFATADLMVPHPIIENAWKYHSRADSQLTLVTGKKFDPAPLEAAMGASPFLHDALIFGNGRPFPGALLFRAEEFAATSDEELVDAVKPLIEMLNGDSQDHARIPRNMLVPMPHDASALEKSSKGTVMRGIAEDRYAELIEQAYEKLSVGDHSTVPDGEVSRFIMGLVEGIVSKSKSLNPDDDLFAFGVDSVACMQIRYSLAQLLPKNSAELPLSIVEDCGTVKRLSENIIKLRHGESYVDDENEYNLMLELVKKYSCFQEDCTSTDTIINTVKGAHNSEVVVLTGATGALGAHILNLYRKSDYTSKIYCLVRGSDEYAARGRVDKALRQKGLPGLDSPHPGNNKVIVLQSQLGDPNLGLSAETYTEIATEATIIMHVAWSVNFRMRLRSFEKDNIAGLFNLINLALYSPRSLPPKFAYCSSVASAMNAAKRTVPEKVMESPSSASPLGYSRSKWVAEHVCHNAHRQTRLLSRIAVFRVGQLSGDTQNGIWNTQEAWPMMLSTARLTGCLPSLMDEPLNWLPVDTAAESFVQALENIGSEKRENGSEGGQTQIYHIVNEHLKPDWIKLLSWVKKMEDFEIVDPQEWLRRLEESKDTGGGKDHPAMKLLGHWKHAYEGAPPPQTNGEGARDSKDERRVFATEEARKIAPVLGQVRPVNEEYFKKIWSWLSEAKMD